MPPKVVKFPRTAHLFDTGGTATTVDDLIVADVERICHTLACNPFKPTIVEEKVDGANLGIRIIDGEILVQNRSHYISSAEHPQFHRIQPWIEEHRSTLQGILGSENLILYGEWCVARHSILYDRLPDIFVAFDLYDIEVGRFYSRCRFHHALSGSEIPVVPTLGVLPTLPGDKLHHDGTSKTRPGNKKGQQTKKGHSDLVNIILGLLEKSSEFRHEGTVEGVVVRQDERDWMLQRYKVVRPDFVRGCQGQHWTRRPIEKQIVDYGFTHEYLEKSLVFADEYIPGRIQSPPAKQNLLDPKVMKARRRRMPHCIMLMGLPASGKSSFARALARADDSLSTLIASQDDLGRKECVRMAGRANSKTRVIVDRCNLTESNRTEFWEYLHRPGKRDVALVYFASSAKTCVARANRRLGHPTLAVGKGQVIWQLEQRLELPTEQERNRFGQIYTIRTWEESEDLLRGWGVEYS
mmetsp:Transcript_53454/g.130135  ORF Transcript_53454/g.130135 Transcript_53454/m.130135 type:complete len:467 (-) Transcript_53454:1320-2720(-)